MHSNILLKLFIDVFSIPTNEFSETITRIFSELTVVDEGKDEMNWQWNKIQYIQVFAKTYHSYLSHAKDCSEMISRIYSELK